MNLGRPPKVRKEVIYELLDKGYNQKQVAEKLGVTSSLVSYHKRKRYQDKRELTEYQRKNLSEAVKKRYRKRNNGLDLYGVTVAGRKKKIPRVNTYVDYDFLRHVREVFKWAVSNNPPLRRSDIELLLNMYSIGTFSKTQFNRYFKPVGIYPRYKLNSFIEHGYVELWSVRRGKIPALYKLTKKGSILCGRMHRMCVGEEKIPTRPQANVMAQKGQKRSTTYYLDLIKRMNKEVEDKKEDK